MNHIVALSGGKDSTAMALYLAETEPREYVYVCTPTGDELPGMEEHWARCEELLGRPIGRVTPGYSLVELTKREKMLPNWRARFCTRMLKIVPFQQFLAAHLPATMYVGLRADEEGRSGYETRSPLFVTIRHPLREAGWTEADVWGYLARREVSIPERTDCARCFYQTLGEWWSLWKHHPEIYESAVDDERRTGHTYRSPQRDTWPASLAELRARFEAGDEPRQARRRGGCRTCTL